LGSTSLATTAAGAVHSRQGYYPYGETRYAAGSLPTDFGFTGQRNDATIGLYDYHARWYDPALSRFISADPLVDKTSPASWNAYSYCLNNPLRYVDPSGYFTDDQIKEWTDYDTDIELDRLRDDHPEIYKLLRALHFGDAVYGRAGEEILYFGWTGLDKHLKFRTGAGESFSVGDLVQSDASEWLLIRAVGDRGFLGVAYRSGDFGADWGYEAPYVLHETDETLSAWQAFLKRDMPFALASALTGGGVGAAIGSKTGSLEGTLTGAAIGIGVGFLVDTAYAAVQRFIPASAGKEQGDRILTYIYQHWKETVVIRGDEVIQRTWESIEYGTVPWH
jgi:RHS repeat-associated protein